MIYLESHRKKEANRGKNHPNALVIDLTSKSDDYVALSPFYPHDRIPVPFSPGVLATCVEGIWQGLKVFERQRCIDPGKFDIRDMKGIKRTQRRFGLCLGHLRGVGGDYNALLRYLEARKEIYLPSYRWVLENNSEARALIDKLCELARRQDLVFLDYTINADITDVNKPLSHASLVKARIEELCPEARKPIELNPPIPGLV